MAGLLGGHRLLPDSVPIGVLKAVAMDEILNRIFEVGPLEKAAVTSPVTAQTTFTVSDATASSSGPAAAGIVVAANETVKEYANVGLVTANGDPIIGPNARPVWGRVTSVAGTGPYVYTVTVHDVLDMTTAAPAAVAWNTGTMGATIGVVELPSRLSLTALSQIRSRKKFQGLDFTEREAEMLADIAEIYSKAGIVEGATNGYANNRYIVDGDTLIAAIDKIDQQLFTTQGSLTSEISTRSTQTADLFARTGITAATPNNYAFNTFVADNDTLLVAIGKLDNNLNLINVALDGRLDALEANNAANGVIVDNETPGGVIAAATLVFSLAFTPLAGSTHLEAYGLSLVSGVHYSVAGTVLTYVAGYEPIAGETHRISYRK